MVESNLNDETQNANVPQRSTDLTDEQWTEMESMLQRGRKLDAIKAVRQWQHLSLHDAKMLVDQHHASLCEIDPQTYGKASTSQGCSVKVGMLLFAMSLGSAWAIWG